MAVSPEWLRRPLLWDGAMGTQLQAHHKLEQDTCVEALNLSHPEAIRNVHRSYVEAGADILQTNTYQATRVALAPHDLSVAEVNRAGVQLAREVAAEAGRPVRVAGSIGPLGEQRYLFDILSDAQMEEVYAEQVAVLAEAGVDLLLVETMADFREVMAAARAAKAVAPDLPLVVQLAVTDGETLGGRIDLARVVKRLEQLGVDAIGSNCRVGPETMKETARRLLELTDLPISIQPNAGIVGVDYTGRTHTLGGPQDFANLAFWAMENGVTMVGGCCHSTPDHTRAMRAVLDHAAPQTDAPRPRRTRSRLERKLKEGEFVICVEIDPPTDDEYQHNPGVLQQKIDGAKYLEQRHGVDVVTIADHTMGKPWLDPFPFAEVLRPNLREADLLLHYSCRNKAETDITGNFASYKLYGYNNILIITGDPDPKEEAFFRYSSVKLLGRISREHPDSFFLACAFDHTRGMERGEKGIDGEVRRLERKLEGGARLALTQPIFLDRIELLREKTKHLSVPILPGIMPIFSLRHAETVSQFGGIVVPDYVKERLAQAGEDRDARTEAAVEIAGDVARRAKELGFPGIYLISSFNRYDVIAGTIRRMNENAEVGIPISG
ncbi:MAG TPA: homocysteine S-methyltransferase family protein [Ardenticatenaceae bacterium]|jgi:homocysteine S-methyltransferase